MSVEWLLGLVVLVLFDIAALRWGIDSTPRVDQDVKLITPQPRRAI